MSAHLVRLACLILGGTLLAGQTPRRVALVFRDAGAKGTIEVTRGRLAGSLTASTAFDCAQRAPCRVPLEILGSGARNGSGATLVAVASTRNPFTFFLQDVDREYPIFIPAYRVAVTAADDARPYGDIAAAVRARGLRTKLQEFESRPEETFENAAAHTRSQRCQTWLGLSRDIRIFAVGERLDWVQPRFHGYDASVPEAGGKPVRYNLLVGRGWGVRDDITRRLEDGVLPILHGTLVDDDITYAITAFASLESSPLDARSLRGTDFLVADRYGHGHMFTPAQEKRMESLHDAEVDRPEETVLYFRAVALNRSRAPRYAFFKNVAPAGVKSTDWSFDPNTGVARYKSGRVFAVSRLNGQGLPQEELAWLLKPGESATFDVYLPHQPVPAGRAEQLAAQRFEQRHEEVRRFWLARLASAARIRLPEPRIEEMQRAGLLHLDLVTYGKEPDETLTSTIGVYSAIGSESSPIIQYMDSMGWHDVARRALMYFLDKQRDSGFMQNFGGYMLETGAALWSMGEHYRYTRDDAWVRRIEPRLVKACEYIREWRRRNQREELRGKGYGLLDGKTADPEDPFRSFMLNGYHYLGLARVAEMLRGVDPPESARWRKEAEALKQDIRVAVFQTMARSPAVPLGDGTWVPTLPPWVEYRGPLVLDAQGGNWFTHGSMVSRDSLLGPLYLTFQEVLEPAELASTFLLAFHGELMTNRNAAFSQPYYSRHAWLHLKRGEVKPFLKAYYNTVAGLADRETYTFWEHYYGASPHKTHEEAWFLMQSRWMLYMERGDTLQLLPGIPRAYLGSGKRIELKNVASYFGPVSLEVVSASKRVEASVTCNSDRKPRAIEIRLPHPLGRKASRVEGGTYDPGAEMVRVAGFNGSAKIIAYFD